MTVRCGIILEYKKIIESLKAKESSPYELTAENKQLLQKYLTPEQLEHVSQFFESLNM